MNIDTGIVRRGKAFLFKVYCGYKPDGKQICKTRTWHPPEGVTEKKAVKLAKLAYADFKRECTNAYDLKDSMRFSELVEWYALHYAPNLKPQTWQGYQHKLNAYLLPEFGNRKLKDFSPAILTEFYQTVSGKRKERLSYTSLQAFQKILNSLFSCAVRQGFIEKNPCKNAIVPKTAGQSAKKRFYMTPEETQYFLQITSEPSQDNTIYRLLLYTGMRVGECLALSWSDIDFLHGFIHINHNLVYANNQTFISTTKTASSVRSVAISPTIRELLMEQKKRHMQLVHVLGDRVQHPDMVFLSQSGKYVSRNALSSRFKQMVTGTPIGFMTLHMLRHSNASLLINHGVDIKIVSEHLGHNEIGTTADIYADVFASTKIATASLIDDALKKEQNKGQIKDNAKIIPFKKAK